MSGQQIGTVVGGIAGFAIGGPAGAQLGMAIGGLVGGVIDPTKINGPKIGDGQTQQSTDGIAITWVQGTARIAGTLVQYGPRRQVKVKDSSGKGGPSVHHYEAHQDFAILVCESCSLRDSTMSGILMVEQDGHIVYDVRPGSTILSDSAKWKANVDFLFGGEDQLPHPTLEAITGVGNQVAYRGSLVAVFRDFNLTTNSSNRIPSFVFTVADAGGNAVLDPDFNVLAVNATNTPNPPTNGKTFTMLATDSISLAITRGLTYAGWSRWAYDGDPAASGKPWGCDVGLRNDNTGEIITVFAQHYVTQSDAMDAAVAAGPQLFTGSTSWTVFCPDNNPSDNRDGMSVVVSKMAAVGAGPTLDVVTSRICRRGGLLDADFNVSELSSVNVLGYPIARQSSGTDALSPLLAAYFAYATEYDATLYAHFYGANATITITDEDLLAGNDANDGYITKSLRNQQTEFPRRIVGSYFDPAQNYFTCQVPASRIAIGVKSIGDQAFDIPVVMTANDAQKAVDKALKVAYATLEGTEEFSVPFATRNATYLSLAAGDPIILNSKRYVLDEAIISTNYVKLTARYDRQSAYVSNVQAIAGNAPTPPTSPYSGPSTLRVLNLPSLRPQDTYGVYLAAASLLAAPSSSWKGCDVQMSLDGQVTWNTVASLGQASTMGQLTLAEPSDAEPLTVQVNADLDTVTPAQLAAQANAFALTHASGVSEIGQFQTATEQPIPDLYRLTTVTRGLLGTTETPGAAGDLFTMLDAVYFVPIDASLKGTTVFFRTIGFGESQPDSTIVSVVYNPDTTIIYNGGTPGS